MRKGTSGVRGCIVLVVLLATLASATSPAFAGEVGKDGQTQPQVPERPFFDQVTTRDGKVYEQFEILGWGGDRGTQWAIAKWKGGSGNVLVENLPDEVLKRVDVPTAEERQRLNQRRLQEEEARQRAEEVEDPVDAVLRQRGLLSDKPPVPPDFIPDPLPPRSQWPASLVLDEPKNPSEATMAIEREVERKRQEYEAKRRQEDLRLMYGRAKMVAVPLLVAVGLGLLFLFRRQVARSLPVMKRIWPVVQRVAGLLLLGGAAWRVFAPLEQWSRTRGQYADWAGTAIQAVTLAGFGLALLYLLRRKGGTGSH